MRRIIVGMFKTESELVQALSRFCDEHKMAFESISLFVFVLLELSLLNDVSLLFCYNFKLFLISST